MNKVIYSQDLPDALLAASGTLSFLFEDGRHVKSAATSAVSEKLMRDNLPDDGHFGSLLIAMGADEGYGFNKNGDAWPEHELIDRHHTFVKNGHLFREHRNTDPKLAIGQVKASAYNKEMRRVELIVHGSKDKAAEEYALVKAGKHLAYSMSARVKQDRCSICDHASKRSSEYCRHLKQAMCRWLPEHTKFAYAINDRPTFFDISRVKNPADRIAHNIAYIPGDLEKAASGEPLFSDEAAAREGVTARPVKGCSSAALNHWLEKLAATEGRLNGMQANPGQHRNDPGLQFFKHAALCAFDSVALDDARIKELREIESSVLFHGLAKRATVFPFLPFVAWLTGESLTKLAQDVDVLNAAQRLPTIFQTVLAGEHDESLEEQFSPSTEKRASLILSDRADRLLDCAGTHWSVALPEVQSRILRVTMTAMPQLKVASAQTSRSNQLANAYAFYKLSAVAAMTELHGPDCVDEAVELLLLSQHQI